MHGSHDKAVGTMYHTPRDGIMKVAHDSRVNQHSRVAHGEPHDLGAGDAAHVLFPGIGHGVLFSIVAWFHFFSSEGDP